MPKNYGRVWKDGPGEFVRDQMDAMACDTWHLAKAGHTHSKIPPIEDWTAPESDDDN